jgi:hypothetical protein
MPLRVVEIFPSANRCLRLKWQPVGESNPSYLVENQVS